LVVQNLYSKVMRIGFFSLIEVALERLLQILKFSSSGFQKSSLKQSERTNGVLVFIRASRLLVVADWFFN